MKTNYSITTINLTFWARNILNTQTKVVMTDFAVFAQGGTEGVMFDSFWCIRRLLRSHPEHKYYKMCFTQTQSPLDY